VDLGLLQHALELTLGDHLGDVEGRAGDGGDRDLVDDRHILRAPGGRAVDLDRGRCAVASGMPSARSSSNHTTPWGASRLTDLGG
jgi:hypothetical protein